MLAALLLGAAVLWCQSKDAQLQVSELQKAIRSNPSDAEAHARLGMAYRKLGMLPESTESLERAMRLDPKLPRVDVLLAFAYMDAGRFRDAASLLAASFAAEQKDALRSAVGQRLVECYLATGEEEQALAVVQKLRQIAPDDPTVLYLSSKVYMHLWNGAFQLLTVKAPSSYQVHLIRAESLEAQERFLEAAGEYRQILKIAPQIAGIHYALGRTIRRGQSSGDADQEALAEFREELEMNPADVRALAEIGEIHLGRNRLEEATRSFEQAVRVQPGFVPARVGWAKVLIAEKQWAKALEHLEAASKLAPDEEAVAYNLMIVYRGLGRPAEAKRAFETFQRLKERKANRPP